MTKTESRRGRYRGILAVLLSLLMMASLLLTPTAGAAEKSGGTDSLKVVSMSDCHVLASDLIEDNAGYWHMRNKVPKMLSESEAIFLEQLNQVRKEKPDVLLLSGDLTKDGEAESHRVLAANLEKLKKEMPKMHIYVINGNHDINNRKAEDYSKPMVDGKAAKATRTTPELFRAIYSGVTYSDPTVIARYTPPVGKESGQESYAARPKKGYTILALDSCCYSADNTSNQKEEHQTRGAISKDLENWAMKQIAAARARGDVVIGLQHHGLVAHFSVQPLYLKTYLVDDWDRISKEFADAGMHFAFTGHAHAQDVAKNRSEKGNDLYDIETGSGSQYPCPMRVVQFSRSFQNGAEQIQAEGKTIQNLKIQYYDKILKKQNNIDDLTAYSRNFMLSKAIFRNYLAITLEDGFADKGIDFPDYILDWLGGLTDDLSDLPLGDGSGRTLLDYVNYVYAVNSDGTDNGPMPAWVQAGTERVSDGTLVNRVIAVLAVHLAEIPADTAKTILNVLLPEDVLKNAGLDAERDVYNAILNGAGKAKILRGPVTRILCDLLTDAVDSFTDDRNDPNDISFSVTETERENGVMNDGQGFTAPLIAKSDTPVYQAIIQISKRITPSD